MKLCLLAPVLAAISAPTFAEQATGGRTGQERCDIAWAYIESLVNDASRQPSVFSTEPLHPFIINDYPRHWGSVQGVGEVSPPPPRLVETIPGGSNAVHSCASIQRSLRRLGLRFGSAAIHWAQAGRRRHFRARIETVSLPTVSADGNHAILVASNSRGGLDAGEVWVHLERGPDGRWRATGLSSLFVS